MMSCPQVMRQMDTFLARSMRLATVFRYMTTSANTSMDKGLGKGDRDRIGEVLYNQGMVGAMWAGSGP